MNPGSTRTRTFIFAGGGSGGHLYPALAIAERVRARAGDSARVVFLCSARGIDSEILSNAGEEHIALAAQPFSVRPLGFVRFLRSWGPSVRAARETIRAAAEQGTVDVIAMGGFVAAPVVQAARVEGAPVTLVNLDAVPGKANKWISRHAQFAFTSAAPVGGDHGWERINPIVRSAAVAGAPAGECRGLLGLDPQRRTLVVMGGSQGASSINGFLEQFARARPGALAGWQVLHQTGRYGTEGPERAYAEAGVPALVTPYVDEVALWWGAADLAVTRAGAGAVGEVWANRVPALFLPYPHHRDEHQRHNAQPLADAGGAVIERDAVNAQRNVEGAGGALASLLRDESRRSAMRAALRRLGPADGAQRIATALVLERAGAQSVTV